MITPEKLAEIKDYCAKAMDVEESVATAEYLAKWAHNNGLGFVAKETLVLFANHVIEIATKQARTDLPLLVEEVERLRRLCGEAEHIISVRYGGVLDQYAHTHDDWEKDIIKQLQAVKGTQP